MMVFTDSEEQDVGQDGILRRVGNPPGRSKLFHNPPHIKTSSPSP